MVLFNNSNLIDMKRYFVIMDEETTGIGLSIVHFPKSYVMWDFSLSESQRGCFPFWLAIFMI